MNSNVIKLIPSHVGTSEPTMMELSGTPQPSQQVQYVSVADPMPSAVNLNGTVQLVFSNGAPLPTNTNNRYVFASKKDGVGASEGQPIVVQYVMPADSMHQHSPDMGQSGTVISAGKIQSGQYITPVDPSSPSKKIRIVDPEKEREKKARQAEAARQRYHRLDPDTKKALNLRRTQAQKRKRQREREMAELEAILRETNDIVDDPVITEQLRERKLRARWAEAARQRYHKMTPDERKEHNLKRRMRQLMVKDPEGHVVEDEDAMKSKLKEQNARKALAARARYHRMSSEEKKMYNMRRTEAFRRRRLEEEALLAMPIGKINGEALDRAQQIVVRNAKRAETARLRYQKMTPDERKMYNQKRYTPKRPRTGSADTIESIVNDVNDDSLANMEREVLRRTHEAQEIIRQRHAGHHISVTPTSSSTGQQQSLQNQYGPQTVILSNSGQNIVTDMNTGYTFTEVKCQPHFETQLMPGPSGTTGMQQPL